MSSPYTVHPMEAVFRAGEIERAAHDRKIAELWKSVQGEQHDDALDYFRRGFFLGSGFQKDQLSSEASPLGHAAKEAECVAKCLDDAGTPKTDGGKELSLWGRVVRYAAAIAPTPGEVQVDAARPADTAATARTEKSLLEPFGEWQPVGVNLPPPDETIWGDLAIPDGNTEVRRELVCQSAKEGDRRDIATFEFYSGAGWGRIVRWKEMRAAIASHQAGGGA